MPQSTSPPTPTRTSSLPRTMAHAKARRPNGPEMRRIDENNKSQPSPDLREDRPPLNVSCSRLPHWLPAAMWVTMTKCWLVPTMLLYHTKSPMSMSGSAGSPQAARRARSSLLWPMFSALMMRPRCSGGHRWGGLRRPRPHHVLNKTEFLFLYYHPLVAGYKSG